jgi:ATP-dependent Clp protease ATP-binding subunit ClpC
MSFDRLDDRARRVWQFMNQEAQRFNHEYCAPEHLLLGILKDGAGSAAWILNHFRKDLRAIRLATEALLTAGGPDQVTMGKLPSTPRLKKALELANSFSRELGHAHVGTEHLLLALTSDPESIAYKVLTDAGLTADMIRSAMPLVNPEPEPFQVRDGCYILAVSPEDNEDEAHKKLLQQLQKLAGRLTLLSITVIGKEKRGK